ncbi:murein hydrolase activator EnvC [soil metagenome]
MRNLVLIPCLIALAAGPAASLRAQDARPDMAGLQAEYRDELVRARRLRADATDAQTELAALERQLSTLRQAQSADDAQLTAQRARLAELGRQEAVLVAGLSKDRGLQGRLLSALQMMSRRPPPPLLIPADKAVDTVRAAILMRAMAPEMERRARVLADRQAEIARIRRLAVLSSERLLTTESAQGDRRGEIEDLTTRKAALLAVLRADADRSERAARVLEQRIRELGGVIRAPDADTDAVATRLPGGRSRLSSPLPGAPDVAFGQGSGGQGSGGQGSGGMSSNGLRWRGGGRTVAAPASGVVDYAGPLSGWGQVIILDLGPGWRVVLAGLETVTVQPGSRVADGQALGKAAEDGEVYFELRREERPVDPAQWLQ